MLSCQQRELLKRSVGDELEVGLITLETATVRLPAQLPAVLPVNQVGGIDTLEALVIWRYRDRA